MTGRVDSIGASDPLSLAGRSVLVIGPADHTARHLARAAGGRGASVALEWFPVEGDRSAHGMPSFHASESEADRVFDEALQRLSRIDTVVVVISLHGADHALREMRLERWQEAVTVPLRSLFWLARRAIEEFLAEGAGGRIVILAEPTSAHAGTNEALTGALRSFARSLAREYGRRACSCNVVVAAPGRADEGPRDLPLPASVEHALFLISPAASFVNGEVLVLHDEGTIGQE